MLLTASRHLLNMCIGANRPLFAPKWPWTWLYATGQCQSQGAVCNIAGNSQAKCDGILSAFKSSNQYNLNLQQAISIHFDQFDNLESPPRVDMPVGTCCIDIDPFDTYVTCSENCLGRGGNQAECDLWFMNDVVASGLYTDYQTTSTRAVHNTCNLLRCGCTTNPP